MIRRLRFFIGGDAAGFLIEKYENYSRSPAGERGKIKKLILVMTVAVTLAAAGPSFGGDLPPEEVEGRLLNLEEITETLSDVQLGGAFRFNYVYQDWNSPVKAREGDMSFDIFRLDVNGSISEVLISAQYVKLGS